MLSIESAPFRTLLVVLSFDSPNGRNRHEHHVRPRRNAGRTTHREQAIAGALCEQNERKPSKETSGKKNAALASFLRCPMRRAISWRRAPLPVSSFHGSDSHDQVHALAGRYGEERALRVARAAEIVQPCKVEWAPLFPCISLLLLSPLSLPWCSCAGMARWPRPLGPAPASEG